MKTTSSYLKLTTDESNSPCPEPKAKSPEPRFSPSLHQQVRRNEHEENHRDHAVHCKKRCVQLRQIIRRNQRVLIGQQECNSNHTDSRQFTQAKAGQ